MLEAGRTLPAFSLERLRVLTEWESFYAIVGSSAAALTGL
jgi:hypothetical protein